MLCVWKHTDQWSNIEYVLVWMFWYDWHLISPSEQYPGIPFISWIKVGSMEWRNVPGSQLPHAGLSMYVWGHDVLYSASDARLVVAKVTSLSNAGHSKKVSVLRLIQEQWSLNQWRGLLQETSTSSAWPASKTLSLMCKHTHIYINTQSLTCKYTDWAFHFLLNSIQPLCQGRPPHHFSWVPLRYVTVLMSQTHLIFHLWFQLFSYEVRKSLWESTHLILNICWTDLVHGQ